MTAVEWEEGRWIVTEQIQVRVDVGDTTYVVAVPEGFETDLASIPRILWPLIGPHELSVLAPVVHDYLYQNPIWPRSVADKIFLKLMIQEAVPRWRRILAFMGVRLGGWVAWRAS